MSRTYVWVLAGALDHPFQGHRRESEVAIASTNVRVASREPGLPHELMTTLHLPQHWWKVVPHLVDRQGLVGAPDVPCESALMESLIVGMEDRVPDADEVERHGHVLGILGALSQWTAVAAWLKQRRMRVLSKHVDRHLPVRLTLLPVRGAQRLALLGDVKQRFVLEIQILQRPLERWNVVVIPRHGKRVHQWLGKHSEELGEA